jgi:hypothetical protein
MQTVSQMVDICLWKQKLHAVKDVLQVKALDLVIEKQNKKLL